MEIHDIEMLKYPVGKFSKPEQINQDDITSWIEIISSFPSKLAQLINPLTDDQLNWRYRPKGWSIRQVVHHCADSHLNSQMRFKLALTEETPTIKTYHENLWAELPDVNADVQWSLDLLSALHKKWSFLLESLSPEDFKKKFYHPEHKREIALDETTGIYAWHCEHHLAHVKQAIFYKEKF